MNIYRNLYKLDDAGALTPESLHIVLAGCRRKWRPDTWADSTNDDCMFCDAYRGRTINNRKGCDVCGRTYWPNGCLGLILSRFHMTRIESFDPRWAECCTIMQSEFDRIESEFKNV